MPILIYQSIKTYNKYVLLIKKGEDNYQLLSHALIPSFDRA